MYRYVSKKLISLTVCFVMIFSVFDINSFAVESPSLWAAEQVNLAIKSNLVPSILQSNYTQATTRSEFCALAVTLYEIVTGKAIIDRKNFDDTKDVNVEKMAAIGVVSGVGNNKFDPDAQLTREQAAVMLSRLADVVGNPLPKQAPTFADNGIISTWAIEQVGQVQSAGIMGGVSDNKFSPQGSYTREQSIITMLRLWDKLNKISEPKSTEVLFYSNNPSVPKLENINSYLKLTYASDYEMDIKGISRTKTKFYNYNDFDSPEQCDQYLQQYSIYLQSFGYKLLGTHSGVGLGLPNNEIYHPFVYSLLSPDNKLHVSFQTSYSQLNSKYHITVDVMSYIDSPVVKMYNNSLIPDFGAFFDIPLQTSDGLIYLYNASAVDEFIHLEYMMLLVKFGFENVGGGLLGENNTIFINGYDEKVITSYTDAGHFVVGTSIPPSSNTQISSLNEYEKYLYIAQLAVDDLKSKLKNPQSLILNSVKVYKNDLAGNNVVEIDYSAMNSFGGYIRNWYYYNDFYYTGRVDDYSIVGKYQYEHVVIPLGLIT